MDAGYWMFRPKWTTDRPLFSSSSSRQKWPAEGADGGGLTKQFSASMSVAMGTVNCASEVGLCHVVRDTPLKKDLATMMRRNFCGRILTRRGDAVALL